LIFKHIQRVTCNIIRDFQEHSKIVAALATSSGKTWASFIIAEQYKKLHPNVRILFLAHNQDNLRSQAKKQYESYVKGNDIKNPLKMDIVRKSKDFKKSTADIIVTLPSTIHRLTDLPKFDLVIIDEAHQYYLRAMVQSILKGTKPLTKKQDQLLLTATPSVFVLENNKRKKKKLKPKYHLEVVSLLELFDAGLVPDITVDLVSTDIPLSKETIADNLNEDTMGLSDKVICENTKSTLDEVLSHIWNKIQSIHRANPSNYRFLRNIRDSKIVKNPKKFIKWGLRLKHIGKTVITCRSCSQAKKVYEYFKKEIGEDKVAISMTLGKGETRIDGVDMSSKVMGEFKEDSKEILILVKRGILGYNMHELFNLIDLSFSQDLNVGHQKFGRLARPSLVKPNTPKLFIKAVPLGLAYFYNFIMKGILCLTDEYWLRTYTGNRLDMPILVTNKDKKDIERIKKTPKEKRDRVRNKLNISNFQGFDSLKCFRDVVHEDNHSCNSYTTTTLREVREAMFDINHWDEESSLEEARKYNCRSDFQEHAAGAYQWLFRNKLLWKLDSILPLLREYGNNVETSLEKAAECSSQKELRARYRTAYNILKEEGLLSKVLPSLLKSWDEPSVVRESEKYNSRSKFEKGSSSAYKWMYKNKRHLLDEFFPINRWNHESALKEARKYSTRKEFVEKAIGAYQWFFKNNKQDELDKLFPRLK